MTLPIPEYPTIAGLARSYRSGDLSPVEITKALLSRIEALNPSLNAFRLVRPEGALEEARAAEILLRSGRDLGPLHGIPYGAKDLFDVRGLPTGAGCRLLEGNIAAEDALAIRKLSEAGMVLLGKTHTVQLAYSGIGINHDYGTPKNPWRPDHHVPGGSSSGSGVAVAAGMAPVALGSDTGGSVRIPASLCGTTGLKTTVGRIGRSGIYPLSWNMDSVGPLARTVEDAALVYQHLQGVDLGDDTTWGIHPQDVLAKLNAGINGFRLAFPESVFWDRVDPEVAAAVRECGKVFTGSGAHVESIPFPEGEAAWQLNPKGLIVAAEAYASNRKLLEGDFERLDPVVAHRMIKGRDISAWEYLATMREIKRLRERTVEALAGWDALLVPTTKVPARPVAEVDRDMEVYNQTNLAYLTNASIGNILNFCGLSIPCGFTKKGLPIGLMIYGKPFEENRILRIGQAFQQATDWHLRRPDISREVR